MLNLNSILLFSSDPKKLQEFYEKVLAVKPQWSDGDWRGYSLGSGFLSIGSHSKVKGKAMDPERLMFNFETTDVAGEFQRMKKLGAKVVTEPYHPDEANDMLIATLKDPDDNIFQLMSPMTV